MAQNTGCGCGCERVTQQTRVTRSTGQPASTCNDGTALVEAQHCIHHVHDATIDKLKTSTSELHEKTSDQNLQGNVEKSGLFECPVCLQTCVHPVRLPCSHVFCFLCVKGVANQSKRCAMCRREMPSDYLENPVLLREDELNQNGAFDDGYVWFYEGNNGWWQYDERTSLDIENHFKDTDSTSFEILIAGFLYVIDFEKMVQIRRNDPRKRRRIKRDTCDIQDKKGVAGLKLSGSGHLAKQPSNIRVQSDGCNEEGESDSTGSTATVGSQTSPPWQATRQPQVFATTPTTPPSFNTDVPVGSAEPISPAASRDHLSDRFGLLNLSGRQSTTPQGRMDSPNLTRALNSPGSSDSDWE